SDGRSHLSSIDTRTASSSKLPPRRLQIPTSGSESVRREAEHPTQANKDSVLQYVEIAMAPDRPMRSISAEQGAESSSTSANKPTTSRPKERTSSTKSGCRQRVNRAPESRSLESLRTLSTTSYENVNVGLINELTAEGFDVECVTRALLITRNDQEMARDILREFASPPM
ncbi:unnamed protein product, partial [Cyprideis torosa]